MNKLFDDRRNQLFSLKCLREKKMGKAVRQDTPNSITCPACKNEYRRTFLKTSMYICPNCGYHLQISAKRRISQLVDAGTWKELTGQISSGNPLDFPEYEEKLLKLQKAKGRPDALLAGVGKIEGEEAVIAVLDGTFFTGSMGTVVGEEFTRAVEYAMENKLPFVSFAASGGARMQEGMFSLMQMAKTSAVVERFSKSGGFFLSVLTHPTMGGVSASFAMLGDVILAEPGALIGFAGPRVIEQTIKEKLPNGFQRSEFQQEHGFVDRIVERTELKGEIARLLRLHKQTEEAESKIQSIPKAGSTDGQTVAEEKGAKPSCTAYERVQMARATERPKIDDFITGLFEDFVELQGDRLGKEDAGILGGIAAFHGRSVTVIGHRKGRTMEENMKYNFGMSEPEGYRKALRLMKQAEKFNRPVITFIDTPGAYPGIHAEEHGQSTAIAESIAKMSDLKVPVIAVITGEGNSGGALAIAVANRIIMFENAVYSILSPEGFASILWKDAKQSAKACELMKMTAADLLEMQLIDRVIEEPEGGIQKEPQKAMEQLDNVLMEELEAFLPMSGEELAEHRYQKFRTIDRACGKMKEVNGWMQYRL